MSRERSSGKPVPFLEAEAAGGACCSSRVGWLLRPCQLRPVLVNAFKHVNRVKPLCVCVHTTHRANIEQAQSKHAQRRS